MTDEGGVTHQAVRVWLLGGFRVSVGPRALDEGAWRLKKAAALVKLLALAPKHRLHREVLMDRLWPEMKPASASNNLRQALHAARRALGDSSAPHRYLRLKDGEILLCPESPLLVDVDAFEEAAETAGRTKSPAVHRAATELYTGDLLPEDRYEGWPEGRRGELRETYLALLGGLAGLHEERGEYGPAIEVTRRLLSEEPVREETHAGLMRLYALSGQRSEALRRFDLLERVLKQELGTGPGPESRRLREEISAGRFPSPSASGPETEAPDGQNHNLPLARDSFVGREREMAEVKRTLAMTGLLTLTGAGGSGKTRLALEAARQLAGAYPNGVWLAEMAPLSDPDLVPQAVASALKVRERPGRPPADTLEESLREKRLLLVLDNCEHLVGATAGLVDRLLSACPRLKILATSREPLDVPGEVAWQVSPLPVPDASGETAFDDLERFGAVRLFVERARQKLPAFRITPDNARSVEEACRKLDGIPLAIELATARMTAIAVEEVAQRLEHSLKLLTGGTRISPPRQQTMRATLEWSFALLDEDEKKLFGRLSVFAGGWTLGAAEAVGEGSGIGREDVLDLTSRLVDKSLVLAEIPPGEGAARYRMLEPLRQYAREKLEESGEADTALARHAAFYLHLAEQAEPELTGPDQGLWLDRLETEHDNLRSARRWAQENDDGQTSLRMAGALWRFWFTHGHLQEGREWLDEALSGGDETPSPARANALNGAGGMAWQRGDLEQAEAYFEQSLVVSRMLDDKQGRARALSNLAAIANNRGDYGRARTLLERCMEIDRELNDTRGVAFTLGELGNMAFFQQNFQQAAEYFEQSLVLHRSLEDRRSIALTLGNLGAAATRANAPRKAARLFREGLDVAREIDDRWLTITILIHLACFLADKGRGTLAARVLGAAEKSRQELGFDLEPHAFEEHEDTVRRLRADLSEQAFEEAWNHGRGMTLEEAVHAALSEQDPEDGPDRVPGKAPKRSGSDKLTRREREIVDLVARGMGNRRVAAELFVSERTVETHLRNVFKKLGMGSRSQLIAWTADRG